MSTNKFTTNNRPTLVAVSNVDGETPVYLYADPTTHGLVVSATVTVDPTGLATDTNQTNGAQKTQIVDAGGEAATVTGGKLDVNATASLAGEAIPIAGATTAVGVAIVDSSGNQISSFGGGTQYTEDAAAAANPVGTALNMVRDDARGGSLTTADGDNVAARGNNKGELYVKTTDSDALLTTIDADTGNIATSVASIDGKITAVNTGAVVVSSSALPTGAATASNQTDKSQFTKITDGTLTATVRDTGTSDSLNVAIVDGSGNQITTFGGSVTNDGTFALETGGNLATLVAKDFATQTTLAAINAKLVTGTDIGDVTINNASGGSAVNIQDGGNSITVDYATTGSGTATGALRVELPTNGTGVIATVGAVTAITNALPAGTNAIGKLSANSGVDIGDVDVTSVNGFAAHDAAIAGNPLIMGGVSSAAAPASVSADQEAVRAWYLRNGAAATVLTAAGALIGGDATNGLDVDVTRMSALVAGSAIIGQTGIDQTTAGTTNAVSLKYLNTTAIAADAGTSSAGTQRVVEATAATGTLSNVAASASSVTVLASNTSRRECVIYNDSTSDVYLKFGSSASTTSFTVLLTAGSHFFEDRYNGIITGIWNAATGNARVTEIT